MICGRLPPDSAICLHSFHFGQRFSISVLPTSVLGQLGQLLDFESWCQHISAGSCRVWQAFSWSSPAWAMIRNRCQSSDNSFDSTTWPNIAAWRRKGNQWLWSCSALINVSITLKHERCTIGGQDSSHRLTPCIIGIQTARLEFWIQVDQTWTHWCRGLETRLETVFIIFKCHVLAM